MTKNHKNKNNNNNKPQRRGASTKAAGVPRASRSARRNAAKRWALSVGEAGFMGSSIKGLKLQGGRNAGNDMRVRPGRQVNLLRSQIVEQDELIQVVDGSVGFLSTEYRVQPGSSQLFPWLSQVAKLYERYKFHHIEFYYKPIVSAYSVKGQEGKVVLGFDYDAIQPIPADMRDAESMDPNVNAMPFDMMRLALEPSRVNGYKEGKFVRTGVVPSGADPRLYDGGVLYFSSEGLSGSSAVGEIHVVYKVELMNPRLPKPASAHPNYTYTQYVQGYTTYTSAASVFQQIPWDNTDTNGLGIVKNVAGQLRFPAGHFRVTWWIECLQAPTFNSITSFAGRIDRNGIAFPLPGMSFAKITSTFRAADTAVLTFVVNMNEGDVLDVSSAVTFSAGTTTYGSLLTIESI